MEIKLTLALPSDELSVPVARKMLNLSMTTLGVVPDITDDVLVALTEACTNVIDHSGEGHEYAVSAGIDGDCCVIEVRDRGAGFDASVRGLTDADPGAEGGRGIQLMRALVDRLEFVQDTEDGTVVRLEKDLRWISGSPLDRWTAASPTEHGPWSEGRAPLV